MGKIGTLIYRFEVLDKSLEKRGFFYNTVLGYRVKRIKGKRVVDIIAEQTVDHIPEEKLKYLEAIHNNP